MKVWIVFEVFDFEGEDVAGVFSSLEAAQAFIDASDSTHRLDIAEYPVTD